MHAEASPRRPIRVMIRTRRSAHAMARATADVPSGELSSTNIISQPTSGRALSHSIDQDGYVLSLVEVGTTTVSSIGAAEAGSAAWRR